MNSTYNPFILIVALTGLSLTAGAQSSGELQLRIVAVAPDGGLLLSDRRGGRVHRARRPSRAIGASPRAAPS